MSDTTASNPAENRIGAIETGKQIWTNAAAAADWIGGAFKGEFSQQQTTGQIVFDATISMFPLLGEGTAARDTVAIIMHMAGNREALEDRWTWIKLVLCLLAVIPIFGGVLKGVGKLVIRALEKPEDLTKLAEEVVLFVNRMCHGNAHEWLRQLDFTKYQAKLVVGLTEALDRFSAACRYIVRNMGDALPSHVVAYLAGLPAKLQPIRNAANRMVPQALKDLNECLARVRAHLVEGTFADISVGSGKVTTREAEGQLATAAREAGKEAHPAATLADYHHIEGWPDLSDPTGMHVKTNKKTGGRSYETIESFSNDRAIGAVTLEPGQHKLARVLDNTKRSTSGGYTLKGTLSPSTKRAKCWLPRMAENGREWREKWAVKMDWSHNGAYIRLDQVPTREQLVELGVADIPEDWNGLRIWRGGTASQYDEILGRWLEGGETQYIIDFDHPYNKVLEDYVKNLMSMPTNWKGVIFSPADRAAVRPLDKNQILPKTVPQGYTNRVPAVAGRALPGSDSVQAQQ
ncbi:hypothetical protein VOM14_01075 [Paraburkholderia sp. MPAMCS5]|uniref:hypothetical protein n=1 Tax=Paraburkholderia sp. MPAMCS5 TaxID=3112563 RepID=UPI002E184111|nr:hypothetical protein [Paraburkholderia sp. MPAMCS5]